VDAVSVELAMVEIEKLLESSLLENNVEFVVVGGVAATAFGSAYVTKDLDICYKRSKENIRKLVQTLSTLNPRLRGSDESALPVPFYFDERTLQNFANFTLITSLGSIDLLAELSGVGTYEDVLHKYPDNIRIGSLNCKAISQDGLMSSVQKSTSCLPLGQHDLFPRRSSVIMFCAGDAASIVPSPVYGCCRLAAM